MAKVREGERNRDSTSVRCRRGGRVILGRAASRSLMPASTMCIGNGVRGGVGSEEQEKGPVGARQRSLIW